MEDDPIRLDLPKSWSAAQRRALLAWAELVGTGAAAAVPATRNTSLTAAYSVIADLVDQGWRLSVNPTHLDVVPPPVNPEPAAERDRVRAQELLKRDEQLRRD